MEAHGGYLCRFSDVEVGWLAGLARDALLADGFSPSDCGLSVSADAARRILRLGYDSPFTYGPRGARWYAGHHGLAKRLSRHLSSVVHVYAFDPDAFEMVRTYGAGEAVGGESIRYDEVDVDIDAGTDDGFEALRDSWPLSHLGRVLGIERDALLKLARAPSNLVELEKPVLPGSMWNVAQSPIPRARPSSPAP